jgi:hypothetical protein
MKKFLAVIAVFITGIACGLILTYGPLHAQSSAPSEGDIMAKLDEISKDQKEMMAAINSIREELQIIKIRITQNQ